MSISVQNFHARGISINLLLVISIIIVLAVGGSMVPKGGDNRQNSTVSDVPADTITVVPTDTLRKIVNIAFAAGEYLRFDINYGFVTAGEAVLAVSDTLYKTGNAITLSLTSTQNPFSMFSIRFGIATAPSLMHKGYFRGGSNSIYGKVGTAGISRQSLIT